MLYNCKEHIYQPKKGFLKEDATDTSYPIDFSWELKVSIVVALYPLADRLLPR
ncbi:hypothetical protein [Flavobacterium davisii]|uniref:hypothetical protein n=1 Tax=Flavobacterium davisii TaxID=2906077 RepID=UPI0021644243|nr:hypothetical protein [Flavobacterium davisii]